MEKHISEIVFFQIFCGEYVLLFNNGSTQLISAHHKGIRKQAQLQMDPKWHDVLPSDSHQWYILRHAQSEEYFTWDSWTTP